jgi:hypothetical protein
MPSRDERPDTSPYRAEYVPDADRWQILDPLGGAICCASTQARADEVVRWLMVAARERDARATSSC